MNSLKPIITIIFISLSLCSGNSQSVKEYFTQEGISLNSYFDIFGSDDYNTSFTYTREDIFCDLNISLYFHNHLYYKFYFYFEEDRMYNVNRQNCKATLVYDFGIEIGETITEGMYSGFTLTDKYPITLLNGEERIRYDFGTETSWIEGIGDIKYGLGEKIFDETGRSNFICAKIGDEVLWSNENELEKCDPYSCFYPKVDFEVEIEDFNISINNTTVQGDSYEWDFGDGTLSTEKHPTHTYTIPKCYNVTLKVNNECKNSHEEGSKKVPICSNDSWDQHYYNDSMQLMKVYKYSENIEYVYQHNTVLKTLDGGQTWTKLPIPNTPVSVNRNIYQIQFFNKFDGIINCSYSFIHEDLKSILVTHDGGLSWEDQFVGNNTINYLTVGENGEAWGSPFYHENYLFRTLDYGYNWEKIEFEESYHINDYNQVSENTVIGKGFLGQSQSNPRKAISHDKGANWEFIEFDHGQYGATYFDEQVAYLTQDSKFYITENGGYDWVEKEVDIDIKSIHFHSPSHGWIIDIHNTVYYTTDALNTYIATNCSIGEFRHFYVYNDTIAYGTIYDNPFFPHTASLKVNFNKSKLGGCFSIIDNDEDGFTADVDCDDNNPDVNPDMEEIPDNMIDDNCNGLIDEMSNSVSIENELSIAVYPNPTHNSISVEVKGREYWLNKLYDINGKEVLNSIRNQRMNVSNLPRGIYYLKIQDKENNLLGSEKILIQ